MLLLTVFITTLVSSALGRLLVRILGWPTSAVATRRWCYVLVVCAVIVSELPVLLRLGLHFLAPLPRVDVADLLSALLMNWLAMIGFLGWISSAQSRPGRSATMRRWSRKPGVALWLPEAARQPVSVQPTVERQAR